jgi:hypothetical protein
MSLRNQCTRGTDVMYTPPHAVWTLVAASDELGLLTGLPEIWECAAGAGHIAKVLKAFDWPVLATDIAPPKKQVFPVTPLDFLKSSGPSGERLGIVTNPPYGFQNRLAIAFITHAFDVMRERRGAIAFLLPFEFDAPASRNEMVGAHPWFVGKRTVARRIRWLNLPQVKHGPMGHHAWFMWSNDPAVQACARRSPMMVSA